MSDDGLARALLVRGDHRTIFLGVDLTVIATTLGVRLLQLFARGRIGDEDRRLTTLHLDALGRAAVST